MPLTNDRAFEILAAYGADVSRWPEAERAALLTSITASAVLQAALDAAQATDTLLIASVTDWARLDPAQVSPATSAALAAAARAAAPHWGRWLGGALTAALAASLIAIAPLPMPWGGATEQQGTTVTLVANAEPVAVRDSDAQAYAMLFTLTPREESLI